MSSPDRPLVSFVLFAYNQERFIREAVEGAFSQTYFPMEIILSDDCSSDRTFEIMQEMATAYNGPHKVILSTNSKNLGVVRHVNLINKRIKGDLLIGAAGDDVSLPQRTEKLVSKWMLDRKNTHLLYSGYETISNDGAFISKHIDDLAKKFDLASSFLMADDYVWGAVCAWSRDCIETFDPLFDRIRSEDQIIPFRAALLGNIEFVPEVLVQYRVVNSSLSQFQQTRLSLKSIKALRRDLTSNIKESKWNIVAKIDVIEQKKRDLLKIGSRQELIDILDARAQDVENQLYLLTGSSLFHKLRILLNCGRHNPTSIKLFVKGEIGKWLNCHSKEALRF